MRLPASRQGKWTLLALCAGALVPQAFAQDQSEAQRVFAIASKSVAVVHTYDPLDLELSQGSAVLVSPRQFVTNWHVVAGASKVRLMIDGQAQSAVVEKADSSRDLALLRTERPVSGAPIPIRSSVAAIGEAAYTLGAPRGLELTLGPGIVSGLRREPAGAVIQFTSPISPGSSGGALLDREGALLGVTTYLIQGGESLNFAVPAEAIRQLMQSGKAPPQIAAEYAQPPLLNGHYVWSGGTVNTLMFSVKSIDRGRKLLRAETEQRMHIYGKGWDDYLQKSGKKGDAIQRIFLGTRFVLDCDSLLYASRGSTAGNFYIYRRVASSDDYDDVEPTWSKFQYADLGRFICRLIDEPDFLESNEMKSRHVAQLRKMSCNMLALDEFFDEELGTLPQGEDLFIDGFYKLPLRRSPLGRMCAVDPKAQRVNGHWK